MKRQVLILLCPYCSKAVKSYLYRSHIDQCGPMTLLHDELLKRELKEYLSKEQEND